MKKILKLMLLAVVAVVACTSCNKEAKEIGTRDQRIGRWQGGDDIIVFKDENAGDGYAWGYEFNQNDKNESDLLPGGDDYHGNGWFYWKKGNDYIRTRNMMNGSPAEAAIDWKLHALSDKQMEMQQTTRMKTYTKIATK